MNTVNYNKIIFKAISLQDVFNEEGVPRSLYCILSELIGLPYLECKQILLDAVLHGVIECDNEFKHGTLVK